MRFLQYKNNFQSSGLNYVEEESDVSQTDEEEYVQSLEMAIAKLFSSIEHFIDQISGILG